MNCSEFHDLVVARLEGILPPEQTAACAAHLEACAGCRALAAEHAALQQRLRERAAVAAGMTVVDEVMARIRTGERAAEDRETEGGTFMGRWLKWRWSSGLGALAGALALFLLALVLTPGGQLAAAEVLARGAAAAAALRSIHLVGQLRASPADNFSAIDPGQDFVRIELWKEFGTPPRWRVEKPGRVAVVDGSATMLLIRPDHAVRYAGAARTAFDTDWLHDVADLQRGLTAEAAALARNGWTSSVAAATASDGRRLTVVTVEARSGYGNDDYLKNAFFSTADTRRVYTFDAAGGGLLAAQIHLRASGSERLVFELSQIEGNVPLASTVFALDLPAGVAWQEEMPILPDNEKYVAMTAEQAARAFFAACARCDWTEAARFVHVTGSLKSYLGGLQLVSLGTPFTSMMSLVSGAQFVPYEIRLKGGEMRKHNLALKRDGRTRRWFVDGGI